MILHRFDFNRISAFQPFLNADTTLRRMGRLFPLTLRRFYRKSISSVIPAASSSQLDGKKLICESCQLMGNQAVSKEFRGSMKSCGEILRGVRRLSSERCLYTVRWDCLRHVNIAAIAPSPADFILEILGARFLLDLIVYLTLEKRKSHTYTNLNIDTIRETSSAVTL